MQDARNGVLWQCYVLTLLTWFLLRGFLPPAPCFGKGCLGGGWIFFWRGAYRLLPSRPELVSKSGSEQRCRYMASR